MRKYDVISALSEETDYSTLRDPERNVVPLH